MPIIHMGSSYDYTAGERTPRVQFHDGEYCPLPGTNGMNDTRGGDTLYETHHGLCLHDYERNGYDDSDWYMVVWDPIAGESKDIFFATTRGWSYPCYASKPDATPEVRAQYQAYLQRTARRNAIIRRWNHRKQMMNTARAAGLTRAQVERLKSVTGPNWSGVERVLTSNLRSNFRKSMRQQILAWINDPAPKYQSPLSARQLSYL